MAKNSAAPSNAKMKRKDYEKELRKLQVELCHLQDWIKTAGARVIVVFEGRDAAGKGGTIKAITERVSPRVFRLVALPAPTDREKTQMFIQRYIALSSGRRNRHLRPELVQPRWRGKCDGLYQATGGGAFPEALPGNRKIHRRRWHHTDKILARGRQRRAGAAFSCAHQRSVAAVEAQSDGFGIVQALV